MDADEAAVAAGARSHREIAEAFLDNASGAGYMPIDDQGAAAATRQVATTRALVHAVLAVEAQLEKIGNAISASAGDVTNGRDD